MNTSVKFSITKILHSFVHAFNGLLLLFKEEHNARIHLTVALLVVIFGFMLNISDTEWLAVLLCIALVISLELINSAIENLADFVCPKNDVLIKKTKDMAAGAVLWGAMVAFIIGTVIFVPKLWQLMF